MHPHRTRFAILFAAAALVAAGALLDRAEALASADPDPGWGEERLEIDIDGFTAEFVIAHDEADAEFMQLAHSGQLSPKDGCHKQKSAGERHWHIEGTSDRGGPCVKVDGQTWPLTNHDLCAEARIFLVEQKREWYGDFEDAAERLKNCIIDLPAE